MTGALFRLPALKAGGVGGVPLRSQEESESPAEMWTKNGFVKTIEEWKNSNKTIQNLSSVYSASVQPRIKEPYGTILIKFGHLFGDEEKQSKIDCGERFRKVVCSKNEKHPTSWRHIRCNEPGCPVCYVKFSTRIAQAVTERVQGLRWCIEGQHHTI